jgi:predicted transposase YdaD
MEKNQDKPYDHSLKLLFQREPEVLLQLIAPDSTIRVLQSSPTELKLDPFSDAVATVEDEQGRYVLHLEFETDPRRDMPYRMMVYGVLLHANLPDNPPVRSVLILLKRPPKGFTEQLEAGLHLYATPPLG